MQTLDKLIEKRIDGNRCIPMPDSYGDLMDMFVADLKSLQSAPIESELSENPSKLDWIEKSIAQFRNNGKGNQTSDDFRKAIKDNIPKQSAPIEKPSKEDVVCKKCRDEEDIIKKALQCGGEIKDIRYKKLTMENMKNLKRYNGKQAKLKVNRGRDHNTRKDKIDIYIGKFEYGEHICYVEPCNVNTSALETNISYELWIGE